MSVLQEFKQFAVRGNVVDMAVGIITGAAFGKIVSSLVNDVIMPPLGILIGGVKFSALSITLKAASGDVPAVTLNYGMFLQSITDFVIVAFSIFLLVKLINRLKQQVKEEAVQEAAVKVSRQEELLMEIRDVLKEGRRNG